jgi:hypothetical protein
MYLVILRIDCYLIILLCLGTMERTTKYLTRGIEAERTSKGLISQVGGPIHLEVESNSKSRSSLH